MQREIYRSIVGSLNRRWSPPGLTSPEDSGTRVVELRFDQDGKRVLTVPGFSADDPLAASAIALVNCAPLPPRPAELKAPDLVIRIPIRFQFR
jgi:hypothetical protein